MRSISFNPHRMLRIIFSAWFLFLQLSLPAQDSANFSTYYFQRLTHFRTLPQTSDEIIFLGNSITDGAEWSELFGDPKIKNRGISGDITAGVIYRLDEVMARKPAKLFLMIGVNDLAGGKSPDNIVANILHIVSDIKSHVPATKIFVQSLLPVNDEFGKFSSHVNKGQQIIAINKQLADNAGRAGYTFINLYEHFRNQNGKLNARYTNDGLHLKGDGYLLWQSLIYPYVFDATPKPALIPKPQQLTWGASFFSLYQARGILIKDASLKKQGVVLQTILKENGWHIPIVASGAEHIIEIKLEQVAASQNEKEAYKIQADTDKVTISANTVHGIYNALQTLRQLMRDHLTIPACTIVDWPAFAWRGYMVDVGRNYMSVGLLKQQIDVMAAYKLNIFHLHLTEDIAWRLAIKRYPQLTAPDNMLRNAGQFYSEHDLKELIRYCRERFITLVPEIDMPGHSDAFRRAMKTDMQSDSGLAIVKNILQEIFDTYDLPYIHIGADEVKITNKNFLPEVIRFIEQHHKKIIAWEPGGNYTDDVIRQLWMGDEEAKSNENNIKYIDSRHLYLNHMDPLEAVVTIFFRQIDDVTQADSNRIGGTLCLWPDRRVENETDVLRMNAVYPGIVTFAGRVWHGGGMAGWTATIGAPGSEKAKEFQEFENRLADHHRQYFSERIFPYTRQSQQIWNVYGPYPNDGNLAKKTGPELVDFDTSRIKPKEQVVGGTVVLRHWWYPLIQSAIRNPTENSTVYAQANIWSDTDGYKNFWIGFNNLSRSPATDSPPEGAWDNKKSEVWVNGEKIAPPHWQHGGEKGNPEVPLVDEGYEYRAPTKIFLNRGWNTVWVKASVGTFRGKDWQNPVKWMFTFIEVHQP